ncbi:MAG: RDD family protein [Calditrichaeota bacterium]|nr:MAG: RDD family protein [Calditrichota bacterium]MBL1205369.1 RDD family protein [Calditrichota bacterium]NOG45198.1 RDD family protein [Calditrichota bacterium]
METINIQTTQNIDLNYDLAGVGDRMIAILIDIAIQGGYLLSALILIGFLDDFGIEASAAVMFILYSPIFFYEVVLESFYNGQTFGKRARNIRVIKLDGSEASMGSFIIRWIFRLIEISATGGSVALITLIISGKGQRLGDMAAGTTVVRIKKRIRLEDTILSQVDEDYKPVFGEAADLSDKDIETLKEVLRAKPEEDRHGIIKMEFIKKTATIIKKKLSIENDMESRLFLNTIIKDYNYYKGRVS